MRLRWSQVLFLGAASAFWPLTIVFANLGTIPHIERPLLLIVVPWTAGVVTVWALIRRGVNSETATLTVSVVLVLYAVGGRLLDAVGTWAYVLLGASLGVAIVVFTRLAGTTAVRVVAVGLMVALLVGPAVELVRSLLDGGPSRVVSSFDEPVTLKVKPDVFFIVLDGYPGMLALDQDSRGNFDEMAENLSEQGFVLPDSAWSAYWLTFMSVPSLLDMDYPVVDDASSKATKRELYRVVAGDSMLVDVLVANGYRTTMVESGWNGGACGPAFDDCVGSAWYDQTVGAILNDSIVSQAISSTLGSPFTVGTQHTMRWLGAHVADLSASPDPDFVFAHLIAPHPPFFLSDSCERVTSNARSGAEFNNGNVDKATRSIYFDQQLACVDAFVVDLVGQIQPDDIVILVGDHGTDSRDQIYTYGEIWSPEALTERMNVILAMRVDSDCEVPKTLFAPNVMRVTLNCYAIGPLLPLLEPRMFGPPVDSLYELPVLAGE